VGFAAICCVCVSTQAEKKQTPVQAVGTESLILPLALDVAAGISRQPDAESHSRVRSAKKQSAAQVRSEEKPSGSQTRETEPRKSVRTGAGNGTASGSGKLQPLRRRVIVVKARWCGACQLLDREWPKLRAVRWRIGAGETQHFQLIDVDSDPGVVARYGITGLPTLLLIENGKVLDRTGGLGARDMAEFYYGRL